MFTNSRKIANVGKRNGKRNNGLPLCEDEYNSRNNEMSKDGNKKEKRVDVNGKLKRSKAVGVIDRCKSQVRRKLLIDDGIFCDKELRSVTFNMYMSVCIRNIFA